MKNSIRIWLMCVWGEIMNGHASGKKQLKHNIFQNIKKEKEVEEKGSTQMYLQFSKLWFTRTIANHVRFMLICNPSREYPFKQMKKNSNI